MRAFTALLLVGALARPGHAQGPAGPVSGSNTGTASIRGRVLAAGTDAPLRNVRVQLISENGAARVVFTDGDGRFAASVAAGRYRATAAKTGYITSSFGGSGLSETGANITVAEGAALDGIEISLPRAAAISGRIVDDRGDPMIGMRVAADMVITDADGQPALRTVRMTQVDDLGEYRLGGLPQGRFVIGVDVAQTLLGPNGAHIEGATMSFTANGVRFAGPGLSLKRYYYPGVTSTAEAQSIQLAMGEERDSIDVHVAAAPPLTLSSMVGGRPSGGIDRGGTIRGQVTTNGRALSAVVVRLVSDNYPGIPPSAVTDTEGRYELTNLPAATYRIQAERAGFLRAEYAQRGALERGEPLVLGAGQLRDRIDISVPVASAIAGRILDDNGDAVEGVFVRALQLKYEAGGRRLVDAGGQGLHRTDDRGRYRIHGLLPGQYIVTGIAGQLIPSQDFADLPGFAPTYFPGTANAGDAQWVAVDVAEHVTNIDFALTPTATARVAGTRLNEAGGPAGGSLILSPSRRSGSIAPIPVGARTSPDGRFEFPNVPPGEYVLQASMPRVNPSTEGEFASQFVTVNGSDVTGLMIRTSTGSTVKGRVTAEGSADNWLWSEITLSAIPVDMDRSPLVGNPPASAGVRADWTFEMAGISGPRVLRMTGAPLRWALKAVLLNGIDVTDTPLSFGTKDQSIADLEVVITDRTTELSGTVADDRGRGVPESAVIAFATDRESWAHPSRFVMMTRSDRGGGFAIQRLPPGEYFVAAIDRLIDGEWQDPDLLESLAGGATKVLLTEGERRRVAPKPISR